MPKVNFNTDSADLREVLESLGDRMGERTVIINGAGVQVVEALNNIAAALDKIADALGSGAR